MNKDIRHVGVLGMRWGVRKNRSSGSKDFKRSRLLKKKRLRDMTNEELKQLNTRMQLERNYKDLRKKDISSGKKFMSEILASTGKQLASDYLTTFTKDTIKKVSWALRPELIPTK